MAPAALYFKVPTKKNINLWENMYLLAIQTTEKTEKKKSGFFDFWRVFCGFVFFLIEIFLVRCCASEVYFVHNAML